MADRLSIILGDEQIDLDTKTQDRLAWLVKAISGLAPWGSIVAETVLQVIPDQRQERMSSWIEVLNIRTKHLAEDVAELKQRLQTAEGTDLLEDALTQASRALSDERRGYIASLLVNGLTQDELDHAGKKKLLSLLDQVSDPEIITLRLHSFLSMAEQRKFAEAHKDLLMPAPVTLGAVDADVDRAALRDTYSTNLVGLGLLRPRYTPQRKGEDPKFDGTTGLPKVQGHDITRLGHILLRYIGVSTDWEPAS